MVGSTITVGVVAGAGPERLERTVGTVLGQLEGGDCLLVAMLADIEAPREAGLRISEARSAYRDVFEVDLVEGQAPGDPLLAPSPASARNAILEHSSEDVVVFLDDCGLPLDGWLESIRAAFLDPGIDAVAGAIEPPDIGPYPDARPGGRLRWTGHLVANYSAEVSSPTSLASGRNCAVRRELALKLGGFDEAFAAGWPYEDVEFFTRLAKAGGRMLFVPGARLFLQPVHHAAGRSESLEDLLAQQEHGGDLCPPRGVGAVDHGGQPSAGGRCRCTRQPAAQTRSRADRQRTGDWYTAWCASGNEYIP